MHLLINTLLNQATPSVGPCRAGARSQSIPIPLPLPLSFLLSRLRYSVLSTQDPGPLWTLSFITSVQGAHRGLPEIPILCSGNSHKAVT